jgi:hypothetical protein
MPFRRSRTSGKTLSSAGWVFKLCIGIEIHDFKVCLSQTVLKEAVFSEKDNDLKVDRINIFARTCEQSKRAY